MMLGDRNDRRGSLASFGLDPEVVRGERPELTWLTISGPAENDGQGRALTKR